MSALITLDVAKRHLRVEHADDDVDIELKLNQASDIVLDYIKQPSGQDTGGGSVGASALFTDGSATLALPDWQKVTFTSVTGAAATIEAGDLRIPAGNQGAIELRVTVDHNNNRTVMFGSGMDGAPATEFGRVTIGQDPVIFIRRYSSDLTLGGLLAIYLSSDSTAAPLSWSGGEVLLIQEQSEGVSDWTPSTVPLPIQASILIMLSKLYDDRKAGAEDNPEIAMGYLPPAVTALLHRFRDPAMA